MYQSDPRYELSTITGTIPESKTPHETITIDKDRRVIYEQDERQGENINHDTDLLANADQLILEEELIANPTNKYHYLNLTPSKMTVALSNNQKERT